MEESDEEIIVLPLEIDIYEESYEASYEEGYENYESSSFPNTHIPALKLVFQQLNDSDLKSVAMVCRSWSKAAKDEICLRQPYCFVQHYMRNLNCTHKARLMQSLDYIKESDIKPSIGFFFLPFNVTNEDEERIYVDHIKGRISESLPQNREAIYILSFSHNVDCPDIKDLEYLRPNTGYALLPQISNISMLEVTDYNLKGNKYREYIHMIEKVARPNHETSTCLMLFCNQDGYNVASDMISLCNKHQSNIVSICGGLVDKLYYVHSNEKSFVEEKSNDEKPYCVALLITGSIRTWSIVLNKQYTTKNFIQYELLSFRNRIKLQRNSVGFMFTSTERQLYLYQNEGKHLELIIFKRLFPEVPIINCFVKRAFGQNTSEFVYKQNYICKEFINLIYKYVFFSMYQYSTAFNDQFSTVFMILTYI